MLPLPSGFAEEQVKGVLLQPLCHITPSYFPNGIYGFWNRLVHLWVYLSIIHLFLLSFCNVSSTTWDQHLYGSLPAHSRHPDHGWKMNKQKILAETPLWESRCFPYLLQVINPAFSGKKKKKNLAKVKEEGRQTRREAKRETENVSMPPLGGINFLLLH